MKVNLDGLKTEYVEKESYKESKETIYNNPINNLINVSESVFKAIYNELSVTEKTRICQAFTEAVVNKLKELSK